jgi:tetratricopeptide (TPR) repeat protein
MTTPSSTESPDNRSFLRTGAEPVPRTSAEGTPRPVVHPHPEVNQVFPAPAVESKIMDPLNEQERFAVWAVLIDAPMTENSALRSAVESCLRGLEKTHGAVWFTWDSALYGCVLPAMDGPEALHLAGRFQDDLAKIRVESVSIGVSAFPCIDSDRGACFHNACKALDHAAFFGPGSVVAFDAVSLNISGDHYFQAGCLDEAVAEYRAALRLDPANANVYNSLGGCLAQKDDPAGASAAFETALEIDPQDAMAHYNIGVIHLREGQSQQALARFKQAHALDCGTFEIPFQIGKLLVEQQSHAEAKAYLEAAVRLRPDCAAAHSLMGRCLAALGETREALMACKKAVKLNPYDAAALSELGLLYDNKGENPDICITFCRQSVALCPDNSLYRMRLAALYHKQDQLELALVEYEAANAPDCDTSRHIAEIQERRAQVSATQ